MILTICLKYLREAAVRNANRRFSEKGIGSCLAAEDARDHYTPFAECQEHRSDDGDEFEFAARNEYAYGCGMAADVELGGQVQRIAVDVCRPGFGAAYGERRGAECAYLAVVAD